MISAERMRHVLYVKKPLEMHVLLGDMKTSQTFTKEHIKVLHVIKVIGYVQSHVISALQSHRRRTSARMNTLKFITSMMSPVHLLT